MTEKVRHILDRGLDKLVSRKLLAWATACGLLAFSDLGSEQWAMVTVVYIGTQGAADIMERFKFGPKK